MALSLQDMLVHTSDKLFDTYQGALKEHGMMNAPVNLHFQTCCQKLLKADASLIDSISDTLTLLALEAIYTVLLLFQVLIHDFYANRDSSLLTSGKES